jgi:hypothetical protein
MGMGVPQLRQRPTITSIPVAACDRRAGNLVAVEKDPSFMSGSSTDQAAWKRRGNLRTVRIQRPFRKCDGISRSRTIFVCVTDLLSLSSRYLASFQA